MVSEELPLLVTVTVLAALVVPVPCDAYVRLVGLIDAIGAGPGGGGGGGDGGGGDAHPNNCTVLDVAPSLTVTWQVDDL